MAGVQREVRAGTVAPWPAGAAAQPGAQNRHFVLGAALGWCSRAANRRAGGPWEQEICRRADP